MNFYLRYLHIIVKIKYFQLNLNKKAYLLLVEYIPIYFKRYFKDKGVDVLNQNKLI